MGIRQLLEQEPVGLDLTVPVPDPGDAQRMRTAPARKWLLLLKQVDYTLQLVKILALPAGPLQIPLKCGRGKERESHYTFSRNSRKDL